MSLDELGQRIGHRFDDESLLERALRHRSWCAENGDLPSNERLEFLGDAVLGWAVADLSFRRFPDVTEGVLTELRKSVVSEAALAVVAAEIGLGAFVLLGNSEIVSGGAEKPSILSDAFEAVLAAVYLDAGASAAFDVVEQLIGPHMDPIVGGVTKLDHKSSLQYLCDRRGLEHPVYVVTSVGPPHSPVFTADVTIDGRSVATGDGRNKKSAQQAAAAAALDVLG